MHSQTHLAMVPLVVGGASMRGGAVEPGEVRRAGSCFGDMRASGYFKKRVLKCLCIALQVPPWQMKAHVLCGLTVVVRTACVSVPLSFVPLPRDQTLG